MTTVESNTNNTSKKIEFVSNKACSLFTRKFKVDKKIGIDLSNVLDTYIRDEEFDEDSIVDDLSEGYDGSHLVEVIAKALNWETVEQKKKICYTLKILYNIESEDLPKLLKLNWNCTPEERQKNRDYMEVQCPNLIKDGENEAMMFVMAVGRKNGMPNLLTFLYDVFTKYRADDRIWQSENTSDNGYLPKTTKDFVNNTILNELKDGIKNIIAIAMNSYEYRLIPGFKFQAPQIYADKCSVFIDYTLMVAQAIRNIINTSETVPFQVDLIIIPRKINAAKDNMYDIDGGLEESDEDTKEVIEDIVDDIIGANALNDTFQRVFNVKYNQKYTKIEINSSEDLSAESVRNLTQFIKEYMDGKSGRRISVLIDRRTTPNTMYIYAIPEKKNEFPLDFCMTTVVHLCTKYVLPIWNITIEKAEKFPFAGGGYSPGKYFQVSYQVISDEQTRLQWNFCGNGIRLTPQIMVGIWPDVFVSNYLPPNYTIEYVEDTLKLTDPYFDQWKREFGKKIYHD